MKDKARERLLLGYEHTNPLGVPGDPVSIETIKSLAAGMKPNETPQRAQEVA